MTVSRKVQRTLLFALKDIILCTKYKIYKNQDYNKKMTLPINLSINEKISSHCLIKVRNKLFQGTISQSFERATLRFSFFPFMNYSILIRIDAMKIQNCNNCIHNIVQEYFGKNFAAGKTATSVV